jgi:hypothetical protein
MKYYVYFDAYGHARQIITEHELAERFQNETNKFLTEMCRDQESGGQGHISGHVGTLSFENEKELKDYLEGLGEEIEGFYGCRSESRPYNF